MLSVVLVALFSYNSFAQQSECNYKVEVLVNGTEFAQEEFAWRMKATKLDGKSTNITGTARIETNGKIIKSYKPWSNESISRQKTSNVYSPNLKNGKYQIIAEISVECNDTDKSNNVDVKTIKIKKEVEETKNEPINQPEISKPEDSVMTNNAENDTETPNEATKNEMTKNSELLLNNSNLQETKNSITAQTIKDAREDEFDNVIYLTNKTQDMQIEAYASKISYVSSSEKSKELILIILLAVSILLNIVLIWRR